MIIENGAIEFKRKAPGAVDPTTGYPTKAQDTEWSDPIPCQYIPVRRTLLSRDSSGERMTTASFRILVEEQRLPDSEQVRLTDGRTGISLGEFSLSSPPEWLDAVGQTVIIV